MNLKAALLGGGSWGSTVASLIARNAPVTIWARNGATVDEINAHHTNETYLPGAALPESLVASNDIAETVSDADVVVMGIPSQSFRSVLEEVKKHIVGAPYRLDDMAILNMRILGDSTPDPSQAEEG